MIVKEIVNRILKTNNKRDIVFVSLCGWADTGKTTLAKKICDELNNLKIESDSISTDSFMINREERNKKGISGYDVKSLNSDDLMNCISALKSEKEVKYFPYDNRLGRNSNKYRAIKASKVIILEGIHSFNEVIKNQISLFIYIDAHVEVLRKLRFNANITKRGFNEIEAGLRIESEMEEYTRFILPNKIHSHIVLNVDDKYNYSFSVI